MIRGVAEAGRALEVSILYQKCRQKRRQASVLPTRLGRPHSLIVSSLHLCVTPPFLFPRSPPHQARSMLCQYSRTAQPQTLIGTLISLPLLFASSAWAAPLSSLAKRGSDGARNTIIVRPSFHTPLLLCLLMQPTAPKAPVIVVTVFVIAVPVLFYRKSVFSQLRNIAFYSLLAPHQPPTAVQVRDLTAEEIAGTTATTQAPSAATARTERRARRNRRTPSQISTRSLPAYMKEPGDLELVIIQ